VYVERGFVVSESSRAKRAVDGWAKATGSRRLFTNEDWREWQANTFAAALLMPEWAVKEEFSRHVGSDHLPGFGGTGIREIALEIAGTEDFDGRGHDTSLAELFTVSRQAMAIRLIDLDLIREVKG